MENTTQFDLNASIVHWRTDMEKCPAIRPEDMDELESHLRDSVATLESRGLSTYEAFWVAKNRIGTTDSLDLEFGKVNANEVWLTRVLWMIIGSLTISAFYSMATMVNLLAAFGIYKLTGTHWILGPTTLIAYLAALGVLGYWGWRLGMRRDGRVWQVCSWMKTRPIAAGLIVLLLMIFIQIGVTASSGLFFKNVDPQYANLVRVWHLPTYILPLLFWPFVLNRILARRACPRQGTEV
jgi:hypothetical protein